MAKTAEQESALAASFGVTAETFRVVETVILHCVELVEEAPFGETGSAIGNRLRGLLISDPLVSNYMVRDGMSEKDARRIAGTVNGVFGRDDNGETHD